MTTGSPKSHDYGSTFEKNQLEPTQVIRGNIIIHTLQQPTVSALYQVHTSHFYITRIHQPSYTLGAGPVLVAMLMLSDNGRSARLVTSGTLTNLAEASVNLEDCCATEAFVCNTYTPPQKGGWGGGGGQQGLSTHIVAKTMVITKKNLCSICNLFWTFLIWRDRRP